MLKGDLSATPLAPLMLELASDEATGCLHIYDLVQDEALVYFKAGLVYSVSVPGTRPQLGAKLVSSGALAPEALSEALEAQRTELQGWRLGELLVHLGYVDQPVVEAFVNEQVAEALWDLLRWTEGTWKFRKNVKAREDVGPPMGVVQLLETLRERGYEWETISEVVHGPAAVPKLSTRGDTNSEMVLDNDAWSMLCKIDGERSVADLARDCGYTLFEAGHVIVSLVTAGLVDIDEDIDIDSTELYGATTLSSALSGELDDAAPAAAEPVEEDALSKLARLVTEVAGEPGDGDVAPDAAAATATEPVAPAQRVPHGDDSMRIGLNRHNTESFAAAISRVSNALSDVLGEAPTVTEEDDPARRGRRQPAHSTDDPEWQRRKRLRSAAAAELASAQALIETLRPDHDGSPATSPDFTGEVPKLLSSESQFMRQAAHNAEEAQRLAEEQAARDAAEEFARAAAEQAERVAAEQEAQQLAAEQAAAEEAERAAVEEAARLATEAAERAALEEAVRLAAEQEAARLAAEEAERAAAEEAARLAAEEAERVAAEEAAAVAAAAAAEQLRAEVEAAEAAAWDEYWHREEAERAAAAQAAAEEAERVAAEEAAAQAAAEEAARAAAEEAARLAAEEAERAAAAEEYERIAAEQARLAAEEAERVAAEEAEAAKAAAKAERAERRKAEKEAAEEAARREDEAAAAAAMLAELNASAAATAEEPEPEAPVQPEVSQPVDPAAGWVDDHSGANSADTAALLRELSSLGGDEPAEPSLQAPRRHNPGTDKKVKKKIGLFGL
jgi:hypothetical protein